MSIIINDNFAVNVGKPIDSKYLNITSPWTSTGATNAAIPLSYRYTGLTVNVMGIEYWYQDGITDNNLVEKKFASEQLVGDFITGATNLGYFAGNTGVQTLTLTGDGFSGSTGIYNSEYNWYYADNGGIIRIGAPGYGEPFRRAYVNLARTKSWLWYVNTGAWIVSDNDIIANVGNSIIGSSNGGGTGYTNITWDFSTPNGNTSPPFALVTPTGSLTTGGTITIGAPVYKDKSDQELHLRTIINDTPEFLNIGIDDYYIRFSGISSVIDGGNVGSGAEVYAQRTGTTLQFRTLVSSGDTTVTQVGDEIRIYSAGGTGSINVANLSGGTGEIYKDTSGTTINLRTLLGTGDVTITTTGDTVVIDSQAGGTYDLETPSVICVGGICAGTELTGKTSFELWEELLVPTQYPALSNPLVSTSLSASGTFEVGTTISSLDICSSYNAGAINPQYTATSDCRSDGVIGYCFSSTGGQCDGYYVDAVTLHVENIPTYTICDGTQTWSTSACHCAGVQPYDSKGDTYCSPLGTGFTSVSSVNLSGIYAWFWSSTALAPVVNQALFDNYITCGGGKCLGNSSGTITVDNFNVSSRYIWFAIPATCGPTKTVWQGLNNPSNNGAIPDSFMATAQVISVNSPTPDGCGWTSENYEVYVSNYATNITYGMQFCN